MGGAIVEAGGDDADVDEATHVAFLGLGHRKMLVPQVLTGQVLQARELVGWNRMAL